jgi:5-hmdU DNA kinase-like protein
MPSRGGHDGAASNAAFYAEGPTTFVNTGTLSGRDSVQKVVNAGTDPIRVAGRTLEPTAVFDTYWHFAADRQAMYLRRLAGSPPPWTDDPILREHRFTNAYRAADRVSQFLIGEVIYGQDASLHEEDVVFRILLFKVFNKIETWQALETRLGPVRWRDYSFRAYGRALDQAAAQGSIYSGAYVIPPPRLGEATKRANHLRLIERIMAEELASLATGARDLAPVYERLRSYPSIGPFLAFQFTIDLNYSEVIDAGEDAFVVAGPGARDGIRKCFGRGADGIEAEIIRYMAATQELHFERLGLEFGGLFGRPLQLIDCQNLFCEVDKYARVVHPTIRGISGRTRIKQRFRPQGDPLTAVFPPRWGLPAPHVPSGEGRLFG